MAREQNGFSHFHDMGNVGGDRVLRQLTFLETESDDPSVCTSLAHGRIVYALVLVLVVILGVVAVLTRTL